MAVALVIGAPIAVAMLLIVRRRRPLVVPAEIFAAVAIVATALSVLTGFFGDPTAIVIAAPVLAATIVIRIPVAKERPGLTIALLLWGWFGGLAGLVLVDPIAINYLHGAAMRGGSERIDALTAGGAGAKDDGVLVDIDNAPAFVLGRGRVRGHSWAAKRAVHARHSVRSYQYALRRGAGPAKQRPAPMIASTKRSRIHSVKARPVIASYTKIILGDCLLA